MSAFSRTVADDGRPHYKFQVKDTLVVIPGDIHFPIANEYLVKQATLLADQIKENVGKRVLFLQGDTLDQEGFSRFPKDPERLVKAVNVKKEREALKRWIPRWLDTYDYIVFAPGNHELRAEKLVHVSPGFTGLGWWWPYEGVLSDSRLVLLDTGYRAELLSGPGNRRTVVEHGDRLRGASGKSPAASVAEQNPGEQTILFGHSHRCARATHTRYLSGKRSMTEAVNVGTLVDVKKNNYASEPNWQPGCAYVYNSHVELWNGL